VSGSIGSDSSSAAVLYTHQGDFLLAPEGNMPRLFAEELPGLPFEPLSLPWYEPHALADTVAEIAEGGTVAGDVSLPGVQPLHQEIAALRYQLTPEEQARLRDLAARAGAAMETAAGEIAPGISEYAIAGLLAEECFLRDMTPVLLLVGTDDRAHRFNQPIPSSKTLERYALLTLAARRHGLIVSLTRMVHFGTIPDDLRQRAEACARIDAAAIAATRPGNQASTIFARLEAAYTNEGHTDEWLHQHQGGAAGYALREWLAAPDSGEVVHENQPFIWKPALVGVQSTDTLLAQADRADILTSTPHWPTLHIQVDGMPIERPTILEVE
jgi:antitoxin VapB